MSTHRSSLLVRLPDEPQWHAFHACLLRNSTRIESVGRDAWWIEDAGLEMSFGLGAPDGSEFDSLVRSSGSVLVPAADRSAWQAALPSWHAHPGTCHTHPAPGTLSGAANPVARICSPGESIDTQGLPVALVPLLIELSSRRLPMACVEKDGKLQAICFTCFVTPTHWDVSVETLPSARRQGLARQAFLALAADQLAQGRRPIWGCLDSNSASMGMARSLGFEAQAQLCLLEEKS
jgi:hypothetical protein